MKDPVQYNECASKARIEEVGNVLWECMCIRDGLRYLGNEINVTNEIEP